MNDHSIVMQVEVGGHRLLLTGDIEQVTENALVEQRRVRSSGGVLKVPHHGSKTSSSERFLQATRPVLAVVSARSGRGRVLPDPTVVERYRSMGIALWRTQDGAVTLTMRPSGWCARQGNRQLCVASPR